MPPSIMTPAQARSTYDGHADTYHLIYACYASELTQFIAEANLQASDLVLDLGTGIGWAARGASRSCALAIGLDVSPNMILKAKMGHMMDNMDQDTNYLARFEVANMQDLTSIQTATARVQQETGLMNRLRAAGASVSDGQPLRFQVVLMHMAFSHIAPNLQVAFLKMVKGHLLAEGGRLVIAHEASRCDMYSIQEQFIYYPGSPSNAPRMGSWGKVRLAGKASEAWTREEIKKIAAEAGLKLTRSSVKNKDPKYGFQDWTQKVRDLAKEETGQSQPDFDALEGARMTLRNGHGEKFERATSTPKEGAMFEGHRVIGLTHTTRHGVVAVIATLERDS